LHVVENQRLGLCRSRPLCPRQQLYSVNVTSPT
jgi:hypothetical protein